MHHMRCIILWVCFMIARVILGSVEAEERTNLKWALAQCHIPTTLSVSRKEAHEALI